MADIRVKDLDESSTPGADYFLLTDSATDGVKKINAANIVTKISLGLENVDNTPDASKPISSATQAALDAKANASGFAAVATSGKYSDLSGIPSLSSVATSGSYTDLSDKPSIPAAGLPVGGTTGQVLAKSSATDYAAVWTAAGNGDVIAANNGSDFPNKATFRANVGAVANTGDTITGALTFKYGDGTFAIATDHVGFNSDANPRWSTVLETDGSLQVWERDPANGNWLRQAARHYAGSVYGTDISTRLTVDSYNAMDQANHSGFTRADIASKSIPAVVQVLRTSGYAAAGDLGGASYKRVASAPSHGGKVQSVDGAWWEIAERALMPAMFGAKGDAVTDDYAAFQAMFDTRAAQRVDCYVPPASGAYYLLGTGLTVSLQNPWDAQLHQQRSGQITFDKNAVLVASSSLTGTMLTVGSAASDYSGIIRNGLIRGGIFDCAGYAVNGVYVPFFTKVTLDQMTVRNYVWSGFVLGAAGTPDSSYEAILLHCYTDRDLVSAPTGCVSVRFYNGGDHHLIDCILKGHERAAIDGDGCWNMKLFAVHSWNNDEHGAAQYGFVLQGGNQMIGCQVDWPVTYAAYRFESTHNTLLGSNVTKDTGATGGAFCDLATGATATAMGCKIVGESGHSLQSEITGDSTGYISLANHRSGVVDLATSTRRVGVGGPIGSGTFTVSTLPAGTRGDRAFVTDANSTSFGTVAAGGGSNWMPVVYNGSSWIIG